MSKSELEAHLTHLSHFTNPPADAVSDALDAYAAHVAELEAVIAQKDARISDEVGFQRSIRKSEQEARRDLAQWHQDEKRALIKEIGFAAVIRDRVLDAKWRGRKTVRVDALLEGRPVDEATS